MPAPLIAKRHPVASPARQLFVAVVVGGPLMGIVYCFQHHQAIHLDNPWLNLGVHVALFILPLIWVGLMYARPVEYKSAGGETILGISTYFSRWPVNWWMMFMMWATPVLALFILARLFFTQYLAHPENLSTAPGKALGIVVLMTCLGGFYGALLLGRNHPATWISDAGLRMSILRFHEWKNIHHLSQHGDLYAVYDRVNPALPANAFKVRDHVAQALLDRYLSENHIRIFDDPSPAFSVVKMAVIAGFLGNIVLSLWLRFRVPLSFVTVVLFSFFMGIILTIILERFRGVSKYGKAMPVIGPPDNDKIGNTPGSVIS